MRPTIEAEVDDMGNIRPKEKGEAVASEGLRRVAQSEHQEPSDQELTAAADQMFQALDRRE
jgi:hypothetical protein